MRAQDESLTRAILAGLNTQPGIRLAILFGSLAAGRERADSDLDLAVDAGHCLTADEKLMLMTELAERTGRPVDLVDLRAVGEPLLGQILQYGNRLFGSETCYADLIRKHLFDQADYLPYRNRILAERRRGMDRDVIEPNRLRKSSVVSLIDPVRGAQPNTRDRPDEPEPKQLPAGALTSNGLFCAVTYYMVRMIIYSKETGCPPQL